jgi:hypothetical protein
VPADDRIHVLDRVQSLGDGLAEVHHASAVVAIGERQVLLREQIAHVHGANRREDDPGVTVRMARTEVVQIDLVLALTQRHLVCEGALRKELRLFAAEVGQPRHVGLGVRVHDGINRGAEEFVACPCDRCGCEC